MGELVYRISRGTFQHFRFYTNLLQPYTAQSKMESSSDCCSSRVNNLLQNSFGFGVFIFCICISTLFSVQYFPQIIKSLEKYFERYNTELRYNQCTYCISNMHPFSSRCLGFMCNSIKRFQSPFNKVQTQKKPSQKHNIQKSLYSKIKDVFLIMLLSANCIYKVRGYFKANAPNILQGVFYSIYSPKGNLISICAKVLTSALIFL